MGWQDKAKERHDKSKATQTVAFGPRSQNKGNVLAYDQNKLLEQQNELLERLLNAQAETNRLLTELVRKDR